MSAAFAIKNEYIDFGGVTLTRPAPVLYIIRFRKNSINMDLPANVVSMLKQQAKWETYGSYETESMMLIEFNKLQNRENVRNGEYTFQAVWPNGRTMETKALLMHA